MKTRKKPEPTKAVTVMLNKKQMNKLKKIMKELKTASMGAGIRAAIEKY